MNTSPKFVVAAHGIIRRDGRILVTRRSKINDYRPGFWDFAGGKLEPGESAEDGLKREIMEEVGLQVKIGSIDFVYSNLENAPESQYYLLVYECKYLGGEIKLNPEEHDEFKWVTEQEMEI